VRTTGFTEILDVAYERRVVRDNCKNICLSKRKDGISTDRDGESCGKMAQEGRSGVQPFDIALT
jgi:hypothetical protein